jgi:hypothetical protein
MTALMKRSSLPAEFLNVGWSMTNTFSQTQMSVVQTLIKDMNVNFNFQHYQIKTQLKSIFSHFKCYFLNRVSFKDLLAVYVSQGSSDLDAFNRICQCNIKFVYDAMRSNVCFLFKK